MAILIRPAVVNVKFEPFDIYIGRDMPEYGYYDQRWGNPCPGTAREARIFNYEVWARKNKILLERLVDLSGKRLGCWCRPASCHGDVLVRLFDEFCLSA